MAVLLDIISVILPFHEFDEEIFMVVHKGRCIDFVGPGRHQAAADLLMRNEFETFIGRAAKRCLAQSRQDHERCGENQEDRKSTRLNSSHPSISYAVFCL